MPYELIHGDCLEELKKMPDDSVDSIVTDPPYGLGTVKDLPGLLTAWMTGEDHLKHVGKGGFMNKEWDSTVPSPAVWKECLRVLKPGGHMLVFAGTRTQDLMGISVRLAGAELRDEISYFGTLNWVMGSGFPKSHDISKAIDRMAGAERAVVGKSNRHVSGKPEQKTDGLCGSSTFDAKKWNGYGTALKPAHEPILLFRKPLSEKNIAENVLKHGTGALNIDGCRVAMVGEKNPSIARYGSTQQKGNNGWEHKNRGANFNPESFSKCRWPANVVLSDEPEVLAGFPETKSGKFNQSSLKAENKIYGKFHGYSDPKQYPGDQGSAARFFKQCSMDQEDIEVASFIYQAKASKADRDAGLECAEDKEFKTTSKFIGSYLPKCPVHGVSNPSGLSTYGCGCNYVFEKREQLSVGTKNNHPTVKPTSLMRYLCKMITPEGGVCLDPFMGSGSTGRGAILEGFNFIGIERDAEYMEIARLRIAHAAQMAEDGKKEYTRDERQIGLFDK